jgi:hypothetical protein
MIANYRNGFREHAKAQGESKYFWKNYYFLIADDEVEQIHSSFAK